MKTYETQGRNTWTITLESTDDGYACYIELGDMLYKGSGETANEARGRAIAALRADNWTWE